MLAKYIALLFCISIIPVTYGQKDSQLTYYQLTIKKKIYPYYLAVQQNSFYFFSLKDDNTVQLLNFGATEKQNKQMQFLPKITPEGKLTVWELFSKDSIFYCYDKPWVLSIDGDTIFLKQDNEGILMLDQYMSIGNIKQLKHGGVIGNISAKNNPSKEEYSLLSLADEPINSYGANHVDNFEVQDLITGIQSPKIQLSTPKPHLVLVDFDYPRSAKGNSYEPFYFFPKAKKWCYNINKQQITAYCPTIITFFDFYKDDFVTYFDSKNGIYKASKWVLNQTECPYEKLSAELSRQKRVYQRKRIAITPLCAEKATAIKVSTYDNLPVKVNQVRRNCKKRIQSAPDFKKR